MNREYIIMGLLIQVIRGFAYLLKKQIKYFPGCFYLVMKSTPRSTGDRPIIAIA